MKLTDAILNRWSPREFTGRPVSKEHLVEIFEAVRWAQSSYNEQPWRFLLTFKEDGKMRRQMESFLAKGNAFAKEAYVLGIAFAKKSFTFNGKPNSHAVHDVGAACQILALKAFQMDLNTRFMAGFDAKKAKELCPENFVPAVMFVIGHAADFVKSAGPQNRSRKKVGEIVFLQQWENPL